MKSIAQFRIIVLTFSMLFLFRQEAQAENKTYKIGFDKAAETITKNADNDIIKEYHIVSDSTKEVPAGYKVSIAVDHTTLAADDYEIIFQETEIKKLSGDTKFYLKIKKDSLQDRQRDLALKLIFKKTDGTNDEDANNVSKLSKTFTVTVKGHEEDSLIGYNYLGYVGTNFDLVDGIKPKNLFFATNIFIPRYRQAVGMSISLYGNRSFTSTDTSANSLFTSKRVGVGDSALQYTSKASTIRTRVSDNLGATFSPLIPLCGLSERETPMQLYFAPQVEFVWRRTSLTTIYSDPVIVDSTKVKPTNPFSGTLETPLKFNSNLNIYDVYFGFLGFVVAHENSHISVRFQASLAYNISYFPLSASSSVIIGKYAKTEDLSFLGRVWITEPISGVTIEAEIFNNHKNPQPYYGVTLSKAINFKNIGGIFQPVTSR